MKKYSIYKLISISVIVTILLSFIIPSTTFDSYGNMEKGNINPISLIDTFANGITSISVFLTAFVYILCIGVFYGVLIKSGKYETLINNTAYKFKDKKGVFVVISTLTFGIMTAVSGNVLTMLAFVPTFIGIFRKLGYDKFTSILTTIGSIILGSVGSLNTTYPNQILGATITDNILFKIIIALVSLISIIVFVLVFKKPENTKIEKDETTKCIHLSVILDIILIFLIFGMIPWESYFEIDTFTKFNESLLNFEILGVSLYKSLIGSTLAPFGSFTLFDLSILLVVASIIISLINKIKLDDLMETVALSLKRTLPYALIVVFVNVVLVNIYSTGVFYTIAASISELSDKLFSGTLISGLSALAYPDYTYAAQFSLSTVVAVIKDEKFLVLLAVIFQAIYSLFLLVSPTSLLILLGLKYTNTSYKEWIKYIGKYFLVLFAIIFIALMIIASKFVALPSIILLVVIIIFAIVSIVVIKDKRTNVKKEKIKKEEIKEDKKEENKIETKKSTPSKKTTSAKKTTAKKATVKKTTKKNK